MCSLNPFWAEEDVASGSGIAALAPLTAQPKKTNSGAAEGKKKRTYSRKKPEATAISSPSPAVAVASALLPERELFLSSSSESEREEAPPVKTKKRSEPEPKREPVRAVPLRSWLSQRVAGGYTTQSDPVKVGEYFVEIKVYQTREVEKIAANERWKHSLLTLKLGTDTDTRFWKALNTAVIAGRDEFKHVQPVLYASNVF